MTTETKMPDPNTMTDKEGWDLALKMIESLEKRITALEWEATK